LLKILSINKPLLIIPLLLYFFFPIYIGVFLFFKPNETAKLLRIREPSNDTTYKIVEILGITIILLGFYFCINSLVSLFTEIIMALIKSSTISELYLDNITVGYMVGYLFKIIIGVTLVLKGMTLAKFIVKSE
jgi:hypothetical protein